MFFNPCFTYLRSTVYSKFYDNMKKLLLGLAALLPALAANAQEFNDFFKVTYNGETLTNGQVLNILPTPDDQLDNPAEPGKVTYLPHIHVVNLEEDPRQMTGAFLFVNPTENYYEENVNSATYPYGFPSMCYSGGLAPNLVDPAQNCLPASAGNAGFGQVIVPAAGNDTFQWEVHLEDADPSSTTTMKIELVAQDGYANLGMDFSEPFTLTLVFSTDDTGVEEVGIDADAPVEYYDLQGRKISNPTAGLYIVKQGANAVKQIIR